MRFFLDRLVSMLREPARFIVLGVALCACGGADRKFVDKDGGGIGGGGPLPDGGAGAGGGARDASTDGKGGAGGAMADAHLDGPTDAGMVEDTGPPPPPPAPGKPGMSILAGGTKMKSAKYQGVFAAGESPGGNGVLSSPNFKLH